MSSKVKCPCGNEVRKNLFEGTGVNVVIADDNLDLVEDSWPTDKIMAHIIAKGNILIQCKKCNRIMIESKDTGEISVYSPEKEE